MVQILLFAVVIIAIVAAVSLIERWMPVPFARDVVKFAVYGFAGLAVALAVFAGGWWWTMPPLVVVTVAAMNVLRVDWD